MERRYLLISEQYKEADKLLDENIGWLESNENYVELLKNLQERLSVGTTE